MTSNAIAKIEAIHDRMRFMSLPLETRLRNTCTGCGCRFIEDDFARAIEFVTGPEKRGRCPKCGWIGTK